MNAILCSRYPESGVTLSNCLKQPQIPKTAWISHGGIFQIVMHLLVQPELLTQNELSSLSDGLKAIHPLSGIQKFINKLITTEMFITS